MTIVTTVCAYCGLIQQVEFVAFERGVTGCYVCPECKCLYHLAAHDAVDKDAIMTSVMVHQGKLIHREKES